MRETNNLHVVDTKPIPTPAEIKAEHPLSDRAADLVAGVRERIRGMVHGQDRRLLVVVGPCSIHDLKAAHEYAERLLPLRERLADDLEIVMRVYFEKPRTTVGWKGLVNDPHLDGSFDITTGLTRARKLLLDLAEQGMPAASEALDPVTPQYHADVMSWVAVGARTTESQTHREMASGLSMPVGFKNGTDGGLQVAINAMQSSSQRHRFLGINNDGQVAMVTTTGNPDAHAVLRGGSSGPNYHAEAVRQAAEQIGNAGLPRRVLVDCSHDNANKDHKRQSVVMADIVEQVTAGSQDLLGVMIESHLVEGKQSIPSDLSKLVYGQSITDACVDFPSTERMLCELAQAASRGRLQRA
jgi:3-deoxy-7-phosphoheptulonate synthase